MSKSLQVQASKKSSSGIKNGRKSKPALAPPPPPPPMSALSQTTTINTNEEDRAIASHHHKFRPPPPPPQQALFKTDPGPGVGARSSTVTVAKREGIEGSSTSSKMVIRPSLAAAMLSFPWPPPENPKLVLARLREERAKKKLESDVETMKEEMVKGQCDDDNGNFKDYSKSGSTCCCGKPKVKGQVSKKLYMKKKSQCTVAVKSGHGPQQKHLIINGDTRRKPGEPYLPVTVPPFKHVHTAWPGFDHAPLPNWKNKYLIAKPWPYHQQQLQFQQRRNDRILRYPAERAFMDMTMNRPFTSEQMDLLTENFCGRSLASIGSPSVASSADFVNDGRRKGGRRSVGVGVGDTKAGAGLPKQRVRLERVGSCLK